VAERDLVADQGGLGRLLGPWDAAALIVGIIIGSGIFATPPLVAASLPGILPMIGVWVLGGLLALCGALCYAELAGMFPFTGGSYVFLREGYGRFPAFAYGWSALLVTYPASIAAVGVVFTAYLARLVPLPEAARPFAAAGLCLVLCGLNMVGVRFGARLLKGMTGIKVLALAALAVGAALAGGATRANLTPLGAGAATWSATAWALSLTAVLWTYEGWSDGPTLSGEMRGHGRDVARALLAGTALVTAIYVVLNLAYVAVLGIDGVRTSDSVAGDLATRAFGAAGSGVVTLLVLVSTLGSMNAMTLSGSRVFYALARDGLFLRSVGRVDPRTGSPSVALGTLGIIAAAYCLVGTFESIIRYFVFVSTFWFVLNIGSVFLHRRRRPQAERPFRVPLYPFPPLVYLVAATGLLVQLLRDNTRDSLLGLGMILLAIPVYTVWVRAAGRR